MKEYNQLDFTGQDIYVGIDTHKKNWKVSIHTKDFEHKTFTQDPKPKVLAKYLNRNFPGATYHSVYEAGFCGFWIHKELTALGIDCIVANPADVPTKNKEKHHKGDRVDSRKLAKSLRGEMLDPIYVPDTDALSERTLVRARRTVVKEQNRWKNRIKGLLNFYGIRTPSRFINKRGYWSNNYLSWLESIDFDNSSLHNVLNHYLEELRHMRKKVTNLTLKVRKLARTEKYHEDVMLLTSIPGIGIVIAMVILTELIDINRFKNLNHLASYVGLVPSEKSSGEKHLVGDITPRGNKYLCSLIIQASWTAARKDPALILCYNKLSTRMKKQEAIIRIARKLLNRIRYVLKNRKPYVKAVVK